MGRGQQGQRALETLRMQGKAHPLPAMRSQRLRVICGLVEDVAVLTDIEPEKFRPLSPHQSAGRPLAEAGAPRHFSLPPKQMLRIHQ